MNNKIVKLQLGDYFKWNNLSREDKVKRNKQIAKLYLDKGPSILNYYNALKAYFGGFNPKNPYLITGEAPSPGWGKQGITGLHKIMAKLPEAKLVLMAPLAGRSRAAATLKMEDIVKAQLHRDEVYKRWASLYKLLYDPTPTTFRTKPAKVKRLETDISKTNGRTLAGGKGHAGGSYNNKSHTINVTTSKTVSAKNLEDIGFHEGIHSYGLGESPSYYWKTKYLNFPEGTNPYSLDPREIATHGLLQGLNLGIKVGQPYPGKEELIKIIENRPDGLGFGGIPYTLYNNAKTNADYRRLWSLLNGTFKDGGVITAANARKWKHLLGGNLLLGPMPSAINNPKVKNILSYMPFTGSAIDIETTMKNPSIKNFINAAISTGSDVLGGWLIRDVNKAKKAYNEAKAAEKTAKELLNLSRKSNVIARSVTEELRRLKDNWEKAYWDLQLKDRLNFILKYLDYPIYGGWLAGDATINYILNLKKGGTLKFLEGGKTSWWNKAINFMNNSGLGEVALNALSTYTLNKLIGTSSDIAKALVDKDKASRILLANLAAELEANDIQLNNVNPENPNAMSGDIVKNFIKNKLLSLKMALINLESDLEKAEIDWQTLLLKNLNTTNMWAGIGSTLMQGLGHVGLYMGNKQLTNVSNT